MEKLRALVYGILLLLMVGWVLTIGKTIFVPAVLGAVIVYVVVGLAHALGRLPGLGHRLPMQLRYLFSMLVIGLAFCLLAYLLMANKERALALAAGSDPTDEENFAGDVGIARKLNIAEQIDALEKIGEQTFTSDMPPGKLLALVLKAMQAGTSALPTQP